MANTNRREDTPAARGADLDPDIRRFVDSMNASYACHPALFSVTPAEARRIVEAVRAPWAAGGPAMLRTEDLWVPFGADTIRLRTHDPCADAPKPALVYIHGGGWTYFSLDTHDRLMREYAARAGVVVIGIDYALAPEAKYPAALEQIVHVVRWVRARAEALGVDAQRIALGGDSAGGNLTLAACLRLRDAGEGETVRAMLLNYAAVDAQCSEDSHRRFGGDGYMLGSEEMVVFWDNYLGDASVDDPLVCPLRAPLAGLPPAFLAIGECDILAQQNVEMARRLRAAGVPARDVVYPGATHSFLEAVSIAAVSNRALADASAWLRATLEVQPAEPGG